VGIEPKISGSAGYSSEFLPTAPQETTGCLPLYAVHLLKVKWNLQIRYFVEEEAQLSIKELCGLISELESKFKTSKLLKNN
jgi:hypothetical protein